METTASAYKSMPTQICGRQRQQQGQPRQPPWHRWPEGADAGIGADAWGGMHAADVGTRGCDECECFGHVNGSCVWLCV